MCNTGATIIRYISTSYSKLQAMSTIVNDENDHLGWKPVLMTHDLLSENLYDMFKLVIIEQPPSSFHYEGDLFGPFKFEILLHPQLLEYLRLKHPQKSDHEIKKSFITVSVVHVECNVYNIDWLDNIKQFKNPYFSNDCSSSYRYQQFSHFRFNDFFHAFTQGFEMNSTSYDMVHYNFSCRVTRIDTLQSVALMACSKPFVVIEKGNLAQQEWWCQTCKDAGSEWFFERSATFDM